MYFGINLVTDRHDQLNSAGKNMDVKLRFI